MKEVWTAVARNSDEADDYVLAVGVTEGDAVAALDELLKFIYKEWIGDDADCTLEQFRNRYIFDAPKEYRVRGS